MCLKLNFLFYNYGIFFLLLIHVALREWETRVYGYNGDPSEAPAAAVPFMVLHLLKILNVLI